MQLEFLSLLPNLSTASFDYLVVAFSHTLPFESNTSPFAATVNHLASSIGHGFEKLYSFPVVLLPG